MKPGWLGSTGATPQTWRETALVVSLGAMLIFGLSGPAFQAFFFSESFQYLGEYRRHGGDFWRAFFSPTDGIFYRPVFFAASLPWHFVLPLDPWLFHLRNFSLTIVNLALLHRVLLRLVASPPARALGVLFFAVSKVHLTTIGYINIYDSIVLLLLLLSMILFTLRALQRPSRLDYALSLLFGSLVCFTKDHGPAVVILLAALLVSVVGGAGLRPRALHLAPFVAVAALYFLVRLVIVAPQAPPPDSVYAPRVDPQLIAAKTLLFTTTLSNTSFSDSSTSGASGPGTLINMVIGRAGLSLSPGFSWADIALYAVIMLLWAGAIWRGRGTGRALLFPIVWTGLYFGPTALIANFQIYHHYEAIAGAAVLLALCLDRASLRWLVTWGLALSVIAASGLISNYASRYAWQHVADSARQGYTLTHAIVGDRSVASLTFLSQSDAFWRYTLGGSNYPFLQELLGRPNLKVSVLPAKEMAAAARRANETNLVIDIDAGFTVLSRPVGPATPDNGLVIVQLHPARVRAGQGFNVQPDGQSALAVETRNATPDTVVMFNSARLETSYGNGDLVSARLPVDLTAQSGVYEVYLKNSAGESERVEFVVEP